MTKPIVTLTPLEADDREQFILDNQEAFLYGATQEFGMRDDHFEEDGEIISRKTIESSIDGEYAETYRIVADGKKAGGVVIRIDGSKGDLELLFLKMLSRGNVRLSFYLLLFYSFKGNRRHSYRGAAVIISIISAVPPNHSPGL